MSTDQAAARVSVTEGNEYEANRDRSKGLHEASRRLTPAGVHHNLRSAQPFPAFYERAEGPYKWDVDGNRYTCYAVGQGSQLLGYSHPAVVEAVREHAAFGVPGGSHELELEWANLVSELIPSAERTRFLASGTEATMLAIRIARAYTRRTRVLRIQGHYNGWHDYGMVGYRPPFEIPGSAGIPQAVAETVGAIPSTASAAEIDGYFSDGDVAGVILEPSGASWGTVPLPDHFLAALREACTRHGSLLIFDEVITAFRYSAGGVQTQTGITPDLTTMGKILTGGLHGGGLAGRAEILDLLIPDKGVDQGYVLHHGTFNGHPIAAAAGIATLREVRTGRPQEAADAHAAAIRAGLEEIFERLSIAGFVYGDNSIFHLYLQPPEAPAEWRAARPGEPTPEMYLSIPRPLIGRLHRELRQRGVDLFSYNGGMASGAHGEDQLEPTLKALEGALRALAEADAIATT